MGILPGVDPRKSKFLGNIFTTSQKLNKKSTINGNLTMGVGGGGRGWNPGICLKCSKTEQLGNTPGIPKTKYTTGCSIPKVQLKSSKTMYPDKLSD